MIGFVFLSYVGIRRTHSLELEGANDVGGEFLCIGEGDRHDPIALCAPRRPILVQILRVIVSKTLVPKGSLWRP